ncbi:MBL fold metallo-hydrolase [Clostridium manihotivorum]|uniref:Zn-dependent hydrolase n=1 Tax=Clostridium manihotivorum TaxID=2320868 RepID=A0A3R5QU52_9CLOT|nr:MBL fold metallo-hydrolase [Clostridium manihotivorum]QAA32586.1 Zn-dependent hydrolase [Clostridium manihotivorum]
MEITKVGSRGELFTFYDIGIATNVYVIYGQRHVYIIDTYLGPEVMQRINEHIEKVAGNKSKVIINTHSHWDHIWGNCIYASDLIIAYKRCRELIEEEGLAELEKYRQYEKGKVQIVYPNMTFTDKIYFEEDSIMLYYTPGHTDDCISVIDKTDKVLYAGDNIESPIPYLSSIHLDKYVDTLKEYLNKEVDIVIGGHTGIEDKRLVEENLEYVSKVLKDEVIEISSKEFEENHKVNLDFIKNCTKAQ